MNSGIYAITSPSGRKYIGSALDFAKRWSTHRYNLRRGQHHSPALQNAFNKYGEANLTFSRLLVCAPADLLFYEQRAIDAYRDERLYNVSPVAGSQLGFKHSDETKARYSEVRRGMKKPPRTPEHAEKIAAARRGQPLSEQARANQSAAQRGRVKTAEHVAKVAAANTGKKRSPEVIEQMRVARANKPTARTSGFVGVSRCGDVWQARASVDGKRVYLGRHPTAEAAHAAILAAINGTNP